MTHDSPAIELSQSDLREVVGFAAACARPVLGLFEDELPGDRRPRAALEAALAFAGGARRDRALRDSAWAAQRAAGEARSSGRTVADHAARAALAAAGAAFLHPLPKATQVRHVLGAAAHAALALELSADGDPHVAAEHLRQVAASASEVVASVLRRYPAAPQGGGRVGALIRQADLLLR